VVPAGRIDARSSPRDARLSADSRNVRHGARLEAGHDRLHGVHWQSNFFDHRIRHEAEADETWTYLGNNPVVKGLASAPEEWPWRWSA
jgi:hypothetical protein